MLICVQVVQFVQSQEYARFDRIVFDTAPTGHTLRLLALPDFVDASLAKIIRLRKKLSSATGAVRGLFGAGESQVGIRCCIYTGTYASACVCPCSQLYQRVVKRRMKLCMCA